MMIYRTIEARCPKCGYQTFIREDAIDKYKEQCPSCGYPNDVKRTRVYATQRRTRQVLEREEWLMDQ
jgi:ribosomal protein L37E